MAQPLRSVSRKRRHTRVRKRVSGTAAMPRLNVFRSLGNIYAQVIDDTTGKTLVMMLGYSHPVRIDPPAGIDFEVDLKARTITVRGIDRELVGQTAANLRAWRPPEPYKGKGVRYLGEKVRRKAGKSGKAK